MGVSPAAQLSKSSSINKLAFEPLLLELLELLELFELELLELLDVLELFELEALVLDDDELLALPELELEVTSPGVPPHAANNTSTELARVERARCEKVDDIDCIAFP